jgi:hypothetical protein
MGHDMRPIPTQVPIDRYSAPRAPLSQHDITTGIYAGIPVGWPPSNLAASASVSAPFTQTYPPAGVSPLLAGRSPGEGFSSPESGSMFIPRHPVFNPAGPARATDFSPESSPSRSHTETSSGFMTSLGLPLYMSTVSSPSPGPAPIAPVTTGPFLVPFESGMGDEVRRKPGHLRNTSGGDTILIPASEEHRNFLFSPDSHMSPGLEEPGSFRML